MSVSAITPDEIDVALAEASDEELGVALFVGKLSQLNAAGLDLGVTPEVLESVLLMINNFHSRLVTPPEGSTH